ncbi:MAG: hypothetical protein AAFR32_05880 [Pseudomonadota bacterium]
MGRERHPAWSASAANAGLTVTAAGAVDAAEAELPIAKAKVTVATGKADFNAPKANMRKEMPHRQKHLVLKLG